MVRNNPGCIQADASRMAANAEHATEEPKASRGREGWACQSAWNSRNLPGRRPAAHTRHQRPLFYRHQCIERMLSDVPRGRRRALRDGATGNQGDRPTVTCATPVERLLPTDFAITTRPGKRQEPQSHTFCGPELPAPLPDGRQRSAALTPASYGLKGDLWHASRPRR